MKLTKRGKVTIALIILAIITSIIVALTYARYTSSSNGAGNATVASWSFSANGFNVSRTDNIEVSKILSGVLAPGTTGKLTATIDVTGSQVAVDYVITLSNFVHKPTNLRFLDEFGEPKQPELNGDYVYTGTILTTDPRTKQVDIFFEWPLDTDSTNPAEIAAYNSADTVDGVSANEMTFNVTVVGYQSSTDAPLAANEARWSIKTNGLGSESTRTVALTNKTSGTIDVDMDVTGETEAVDYTITLNNLSNAPADIVFTGENGQQAVSNGSGGYVLTGTIYPSELTPNANGRKIKVLHITYTGTDATGKLETLNGLKLNLVANNGIMENRGMLIAANNNQMTIQVKVRGERTTKTSIANETIQDIEVAEGATYAINLANTVEDVTYTSNNTSIASVTNEGVVTGVTAGNTTLTITGKSTGATKTVNVTVVDPGPVISKLIANGEIAVGDTVNYNANAGLDEPRTYKALGTLTGHSNIEPTYTTNSNITWKVLKIDETNNTIELVAANNVTAVDTSKIDGKLPLKGQLGFKNAETVLNNICEIYGYGTGAIGARSIKLEDIEKYSSYDKTTYINSESGRRYGDKRVYTSGIFFKEIRDNMGNVIGYESELTTASAENEVEMTLTFYDYGRYDNEPREYFSDTIYNLLIKGRDYWLASRSVYLYSGDCRFIVPNVSSSEIGDMGNGNFGSDNYITWTRHSVCPVVTLATTTKLEKDGNDVWQIIP